MFSVASSLTSCFSRSIGAQVLVRQQAVLARQQPPLQFAAAAAALAGNYYSTTAPVFQESKKNLIVNAVGRDRCGIVSDITGLVIQAGGNVGESQAAKLGNYFSLMMMIQVPSSSSLDDLKSQLQTKCPSDMNATMFEVEEDATDKMVTPGIGYSGRFSLEGADNPGIVHRLTTALAQAGLSIDKMETSQEIAPYGGSVLFKMQGIANAPAPLAKGFDVEAIKSDLTKLGDSLNCEVTMEDVNDESASGSFYVG